MKEIKLRTHWRHPKIRRTNDEGTCIWCGRKLRLKLYNNTQENRGDYMDNAFCGLRCGYSFGVALASHGYRLQPRSDDDA